MKKNKQARQAEELLNALAAGEITSVEFKERAKDFLPSAFLFRHPGNKYTLLPWANEGEGPTEEIALSREELPGIRDKYRIRAVITLPGIPPVLREEDLPIPD